MKREKTKSRRGSAIITALMLAGIGGLLISILIRSAAGEKIAADKRYHSQNASRLAISGVEMAIMALSNDVWDEWDLSFNGEIRTQQFSGIETANHSSAVISILLKMNDGFPIVVSNAEVLTTTGASYKHQKEANLRPHSIFGNGLTVGTRTYFLYYGNIGIDSYNSAVGLYDPFLNRNDNGTVVSTNLASYHSSNAQIFGYLGAKLGANWYSESSGIQQASNPLARQIGYSGKVTGFDSLTGDLVDLDRVVGDIHIIEEEIEAPAIKYPTVLPRFGRGARSTVELGQSAESEFHLIENDLTIPRGKTLRISGNVVLVVKGNLNIQGALEVGPPFGRLTLYCDGSLFVIGNGLVNEWQQPDKLVIFHNPGGLYSNGAVWLGGNTPIHAAIYAPHSSVYLFGHYQGRPFYGSNKDFYGSLVAKNVLFYGDYEFHFDESLKEYVTGNPIYLLDNFVNLDSDETQRLDQVIDGLFPTGSGDEAEALVALLDLEEIELALFGIAESGSEINLAKKGKSATAQELRAAAPERRAAAGNG